MGNLRSAFTAIAGSAQQGAQEFTFVTETANRMGLELKGLAESYRGLSAATRGTALEGTATKELFTALTGASRTYGLSTEQTGRALRALEQIVSKGKVMQEELRGQLSEAIPGAMQIAARAYGVGTKALEDLVAKGLDSVDFVKRFTAQLRVEVPMAAERAGSGIARMGNEILLLKERIAQSGLMAFLDSAANRMAGLLKGSREPGELAKHDVLQALGKTAGVAKPEEMASLVAERTRINEISQALNTPGNERAQSMLRQWDTEARAREQAQIDLLKRRYMEQAHLAGRQKEINDQQTANDAIVRDETANTKQLKTTIDDLKKSKDDLNKSSAQTPAIYGKINGTLAEQNVFLEKRKALTEGGLTKLTETIIARSERTGEAPADLLAEKARLEQSLKVDTDKLAANKKAEQDAKAAASKAEADAKAAARKAEQLAKEQEREAEQQAKAEVQRLKEIGAEEDRNIETLRTLAGRYGTVKEARDADTASMLQAQLATSQYANEAERLAQVIADVQRVEAQLPGLRAAAERSAADLASQQAAQGKLDQYEELLGMADGRKITSDERRYVRAKRDLEGQGLDPERVKHALRQLQPEFLKLRNVAEEFSQSFLSSIEAAATGGIKSFKQFADSVIMDLARILQRQYLAPALSKLLDAGISAGITALGLAGGGGVSPDLVGANIAATPTIGAPPRAEGGPVMPGKFYTVGERGPELLYAGGNGQVIPPEQMGRGATTVVFNISTPDAGSFRRSSGEIEARMVSALQRAQRNA